jgi:hypothetical protein
LARLPEAVQKTGHISSDETWSGTIHITGDIQVDPGATLTVLPGTLILIAARSDDQHGGHFTPVDRFNPKDPPFEGDKRVEFWVQGTLLVQGTLRDPVIFTSDASQPRNDDWGKFLCVGDSARVEITGAIVEFFRSLGIGASKLVIQKSILRNMMEAVVIGDIRPETNPSTCLGLTPTLTQNYIYNTGRNAVTVRSGAPTISHNVIVARPDMDTTGWEQGALSLDFPSCAIVHHNYLDGGQPRPYGGSVHGTYRKYTDPHGFVMAGICPFTFEYNTVMGSPQAIGGHAGSWSLEYNNIIPRSESAQATCLFAYDHGPEASDEWQFLFLEKLGGVPTVDVFSAPHNFWGTADQGQIERCLHAGSPGLRIDYQPFATEFIKEALPNWREFQW